MPQRFMKSPAQRHRSGPGHDWGEMEKLVAAIVERRNQVRELITAFHNSTRQPFPSWGLPTEAKTDKKSVVQ